MDNISMKTMDAIGWASHEDLIWDSRVGRVDLKACRACGTSPETPSCLSHTWKDDMAVIGSTLEGSSLASLPFLTSQEGVCDLKEAKIHDCAEVLPVL